MSKNKHKHRAVMAPNHNPVTVDAVVIEAPVIPEVKPSLFARAKARVKSLFTRTPKATTVATGRTAWSRLWAAVKRLTQTAVVKPAKAVGRFVARIGRFVARTARTVAAFFARTARRIANTRAFKIAHTMVRMSLLFTLTSAWIAAFVTAPFVVVVYTVAGYILLETVGYGMLKLKDWENTGSKIAAGLRTFIHVVAKTVYVVMQLAVAASIVVGLLANPALLVLEVVLISGLVWFSSRIEREAAAMEAAEAFVPRWQAGTCKTCKNEALVNAAGLCRDCKREEVERETDPFEVGHAPLVPAMG